ncbi:MAG: MotA/TolQ/ExbB proton channel family protein [Lentisphaeria bacterium]
MRIIGIFFSFLGSSILLAPAVWAQSPEGAAGATGRMSLEQILAAGGWPLKVVILLSIVSVFLVVFFIFSFRAHVLVPKTFYREADQAAEEGDVAGLELACRNDASPASRIIGAATRQMQASERFDYMAVRDAVEDEGGRQATVLWQRLQYLMDIAVIAPMVGLLGTVLGMLDSFAGMEAELGAVRPSSLSQGVAKALITTAGGLIVGIGAMILYAVFRGHVNRLIAYMEESCSQILRKMADAQPAGR